MVNGIKLALDDAHHKVGDFTIEYQDMDDATAPPAIGLPMPKATMPVRLPTIPTSWSTSAHTIPGAAKVSMPFSTAPDSS